MTHEASGDGVQANCRVFQIVERRSLERDVLRTMLERAEYQVHTLLERIQQDDFETPEYRSVLAAIQISVLRSSSFDLRDLEPDLHDTVVEIVAEGRILNGLWSVAAERLRNHQFDRGSFPFTDTGNAERFDAQFGETTRYDYTRGKWIFWDGRIWKPDNSGKATRLMVQTVRAIHGEAESIADEKTQKKCVNWALKSESCKGIADALRLAQAQPRISIESDAFDRDPQLLNLQNGLYDLRQGQFVPHDHRFYCSKVAGAAYQLGAHSSWWDEFLHTIFVGDDRVIAFIQQAVGYSLSGLTDAQVLFFMHGNGANGKSTVCEILRLLMGDYYQKAASELLMLRRPGAIPTDVARLYGVRLAVCSETDQDYRLHESKLKDLTGSDRLTARHLYRHPFEFKPTHKLWLYGNHRPVLVGNDEGLWRRIHLIPFMATIPDGERKPMRDLLARAQRELPGILNWALEGWHSYKEGGLDVPEMVRLATRDYRSDSDSVGQFIAECCVEREGVEVATTALYGTYREWAGEAAMGHRAFFTGMKEKGFQVQARGGRRRFWLGIALQSDQVTNGA